MQPSWVKICALHCTMCDPVTQLYNAEPSYIFVQSTTPLQKVYNEVVEQGRPCQAHGAPFPCHRDSDSAKFPSILLYSLCCMAIWNRHVWKKKKGGFLLMSLLFNPQKNFCNCYRSFFTRRNSFEPINQGTSEDAGTQGFIFVFQTNFQSRKPFPYPFQIQII